jgi:hypothetical protein
VSAKGSAPGWSAIGKGGYGDVHVSDDREGGRVPDLGIPDAPEVTVEEVVDFLGDGERVLEKKLGSSGSTTRRSRS